MSKTASTAQLSGVSMNKLLGYIGTISEVTRRDAGSIGTSLNSIFSRMEKVTNKAASGTGDINEVETALKNVGVQLRSADDTFRSSGDVLDDLAEKWDTLSSVQQQNIAYDISGTRQKNAFIVLMQNYKRALELSADAADSAGLADARYGAYLESVAGKQKTMTAAAEEFTDTVFNSKVVAGFYSVGTAVLKLFTQFQKLTGGMGFWVLTGLTVVKVLKSIDLAAIFSNVPLLGPMFLKAKTAVEALSASFATMGTAATVATAGLTVAFGIALAVIYKQLHPLDEINKKISDYTLKLSDLRSEQETLKNSSNLSEAQKEQLDFLQKEIDLNAQLEKNEETKKFKTIEKGKFAVSPEYTDEMGLTYTQKLPITRALQESTEEYSKLISAEKNFDKNAPNATKQASNIERLRVNVQNLAGEYEKIIKNFDDYQKAGNKLDKSQQNLYDKLKKFVNDVGSDIQSTAEDASSAEDDLTDSTDETTDAFSSMGDEVDKSVKSASTSMSDLKGSVTDLAGVVNEMNSTGQVSIDTILDLMSSGSELLGFLEEENGTYKISQESMEAYFEYKKQATLADMAAQIDKAAAAIQDAELEIGAEEGIADAAGKCADSSAAAAKSIVASYSARASAALEAAQAAAVANAQTVAMSNFTSGTNEQNAAIAQQKLKLEAMIKSYNVLSNMTYPQMISSVGAATSATKAQSAAQKEENEQLKAAQKAAEDYLDTLKDQKAEQDAIAKAIEKIIQKEIDALKDQKEALADTYDARIDALKAQEDALSDQEDTEDKLLEIEKARVALQEAQQAKNTKVYTEGKGWVWSADAGTVSSAQDKLDELQKSWKREQEKKAIDDTITKLEAEKKAAEDNIDAQVKALQKLKDGWNEATDTTMTDLNKWEGALDYVKSFENANYTSRIGMMNSFTSNYVNLCNQIIDAEKAVAAAKANAESASNVSYSGGSYSGGGGSQVVETGLTYGEWEKYGVSELRRAVYRHYSDGSKKIESYQYKALKKSYTTGFVGGMPSGSYATGGVDTIGGMAELHGTPNQAEVIFNAAQGKALYNFVNNLSRAEKAGTNVTNSTSKQSSIVINRLEVKAPNNATIDTIITSAMQKVQTTR